MTVHRILQRRVLVSVAIAAAFGLGWRLAGAGPSNQTRTSPAASALSLQPCNLPGVSGPARCGTYEVFEDRAAKSGRKIKLHIIVLSALDKTPTPDPVFVFHGGPGGAATDLVQDAARSYLKSVREHRDIVFVDQRGTGQSNPLNCDVGDDPADLQTFFGELLPPELVRACRQKLEAIADLKLYTTPIAMDDLDDVRAALGYNKINLAGSSYGTIAAQVYIRQHPEHVRAAVLVGVATPAIKQPLLFAPAAQHALDLLFEDCAADSFCHSTYPNLKEEFRQELARFDKGPLEVELVNPSTQQKQRVLLARGSFVERIRLLLYSTSTARFAPFVIHRFYENDYSAFETAAIATNPGGAVSRGMYFTVTCSEGVPFISDQEMANETRNTFVGDYRVRVHREACKQWPRGAIPDSYIDPIKSTAPVLMISGEADGSTPPWYGEAAIKYLPNGRQVKIRYYGHQITSQCVWNIIRAFLEKGTTTGLDTSCTAGIKRPPFATALPPL